MIILALIAAVFVGLFVYGFVMAVGRGLFPRAGLLGLIIFLGAVALGLNAGASVFTWIR